MANNKVLIYFYSSCLVTSEYNNTDTHSGKNQLDKVYYKTLFDTQVSKASKWSDFYKVWTLLDWSNLIIHNFWKNHAKIGVSNMTRQGFEKYLFTCIAQSSSYCIAYMFCKT